MKRKLVIFGAGALGELAHWYFTRDSDYRVVAFLEDGNGRNADNFCGLPVGRFEDAVERYPPADHAMFIAVGYSKMNAVRIEKYLAAKKKGYLFASYVSGRATVLTEESIGENCFILEDTTIQPFAKIGDNVTIWSGCHIGHHAVIEDHCFLTSHVVVSGECCIGSASFLGVNATLHDHIALGPRTLVGAGAIIAKDTEEGSVYVPPRSIVLERNSDTFF